MPQVVQVGDILIEAWPAMTKLFGIESEPYSGSWSVVKALNGFGLERKVHAAGWNFFFMAAEVHVMFLGARGADKIHSALTRILGKVRGQDFNCLEVTEIIAKRFLGVPYTRVSAHSRHIQQSCYLDSAEVRRA
ncbi:MAG: hypothetical protein QOF94_1362 [Acidobacteriaceae bacterium]|jgi:hypothetical protein|nr:hypothetical protein [Acidobacteriaceae bacterium]